MKFIFVVSLFIFSVSLSHCKTFPNSLHQRTCSTPDADRTGYVTSPIPGDYIPENAIPSSVDWSNMMGQNYMTFVRQQHLPQYCGSCWAFATTSALSSRFRIATRKANFEIDLAPQVVLNCGGAGTCHGGSPMGVYKFAKETGIPHESCYNYQALDMSCSAENTCQTCDFDLKDPGAKCHAVTGFNEYKASEYGPVSGEQNMMAEIAARGPISCTVSVTESFVNYTGTGVFTDSNPVGQLDHEIYIFGYGTTQDGQKFWRLGNNWGESWGDRGYMLIERGSNTIGVESSCSWATPDLSSMPSDMITDPATLSLSRGVRTKVTEAKAVLADSISKASSSVYTPPASIEEYENMKYVLAGEKPVHPLPVSERGACMIKSDKKVEYITEPLPKDTVRDSDLPDSYDIRNVSGVNYGTPVRQQHGPLGYCGSCWSMGSTSAMADRIALLRKGKFPEVFLAPQHLINCDYGGTCDGGSPALAYEAIRDHGIPPESCVPYQSKNGLACTPACKHCRGFGKTCTPAKDYTLWKVGDIGSVRGEKEMKKEILARGPIACGIMATKKLDKFKGKGIFREFGIPMINHIISVIGWGQMVDSDGKVAKYWTVRNSWGLTFGDQGIFKLPVGSEFENLGVETDCTWAVPIIPPNWQ